MGRWQVLISNLQFYRANKNSRARESCLLGLLSSPRLLETEVALSEQGSKCLYTSTQLQSVRRSRLNYDVTFCKKGVYFF
jgi:hypothetical protein